MAFNHTPCLSIEQRSVNKFLVAKKYKPSKIYKRMCDIYGEACFLSKKFRLAKHGFAL